jgi:hypothetical protein
VETLWCEIDERVVSTMFSFAVQGNSFVAVMIVKIVAESLAPNFKAQVLVAAIRSSGFRQRLNQSDDTRPPSRDD